MPQHETKMCERCNEQFECKCGDIINCDCSKVQLSVEERAFIESRYTDCLCVHCLLQLRNRYVLFKEKYFLS